MPDPEWTLPATDHRLRVVIAGSRAMPAGVAARLLIRFVAALPEDAIVLLRGRADGNVGDFESDVRALCRVAQIDYQMCVPWALNEGGDFAEEYGGYIGREGVLRRDNLMIEHADLVLAFVSDYEVEARPFSGTRHLVEAAYAHDKAVFMYALKSGPDNHGEVTQIGQNDPFGAWAEKVPQP